MPKILSKFVFNKLIYDYLDTCLDKSKINKFEQKMNAEHDCKDQVELVKKSMSYMHELSHVEIDTKLSTEIINIKSVSSKNRVINTFQHSYFRGLTLIFLLSIIGLSFYKLTTFIPQDLFIHFDLNKPSFFKSTAQQGVSKNEIDPVINGIYKRELLSKASIVDNIFEREYKVPISQNKEIKASKVSLVEQNTQGNKSVVKVVKKVGKGPKGELYRYYMSLHDLDLNSDKIKNMIVELSGEKAGEKPLGYKKPKGRYFHLKLPENQLEALNERLADLGRVKVDHEKHWRQMAEGKSRVIIWVEDLDLKALRKKRR